MSHAPLRSWSPYLPNLSPAVQAALGFPCLDPRGPEIARLLDELRPRLCERLGTSATILLLPAALPQVREAVIRNCVRESVLHFVTGPDSQDWFECSQALGKQAMKIKLPAGQAVEPEAASQFFSKDPGVDAVALLHVEPGTGAQHALRELSPILRSEDRLLLVDGSHSFLSSDFGFDRDRIDVFFCGSQVFGLPEGLTMVALSMRALDAIEANGHRGHALDFLKLSQSGQLIDPAHAPSSQLLMALAVCLKTIDAETWAQWENRHWRLAALARAFAKEHFELASKDGYSAYSLTCIKVPEGFPLAAFHAQLRAAGFVLGEGRGELKDSSFTIGHSGRSQLTDLEAFLNYLSELARTVQEQQAS